MDGMDLQQVVETTVEGLDYELVALERAGRGLLRVFIDHPEGISVDDCVLVSDQLSRVFTVENIAYERLEISSPGMDRPLRKPEHFLRFVGEQVKLRLRVPREGRKVFEGRLLAVLATGVQIELEAGPAEFAFDAIDRANLVPVF
jgi:ribosome maturation factor RimP